MSNKKIFILIAAFLIATISTFNVSINSNERGLSNVSLNNVEALAQESGSPSCVSIRGYCYVNGLKSEHTSFQ